MLGLPADDAPLAELWFGAHPAGPALVQRDGECVALDAVVANDPQQALGPNAARWQNRLPFMLKLIAADAPLSIQVHPDAEKARAGFARDEAAGRGLDDPERRYQDRDAKPELVCALDDFDALIDFRPQRAIVDDLVAAGLANLASTVRERGLAAGVRQVLTSPGNETAEAIAALVAHGNEVAAVLAAAYPGDPGVVLATFLNHIRLRSGEAVELAPGTVHAYLHGFAVEVMAASDNVLRAGLTSKLVDVDEFLAVSRLDSRMPDVLHPDESGAYPVRAEQFGLRRHRGGTRQSITGPAVVVCTEGSVEVDGVPLDAGHGLFVPAGAPPSVVDGSGEAYIGVAGVAGVAG
jgi:mannose-6-phosphate isomerase